MTAHLESTLAANLQTAAQQAGLAVLSIDAGSDFNGHPTTRFRLATTADAPLRNVPFFWNSARPLTSISPSSCRK
jgi:hypothetical protein